MNAITPPGGREPPKASPAPGQRPIDALRTERQAPDPNARRQPATVGTQVVPELNLPAISVGFGSLPAWEFTQRVARALASSTMVPEQYRLMVPKKRNRDELIENHNAIPNCIVALNIANRMGIDVLAVMQNLDVVEGRPSWRGKFYVAQINNSGLFGRLKFRFEDRGEKEVIYETYEWNDEIRTKVAKQTKVKIRDLTCTAYATEKGTGEVLEGPTVSIELAVQEGWYTKNGSKWRTMPMIMLPYRAASMFGNIHAPDLFLGLPTTEEMQDVLEAQPGADGAWEVTTASAEEAPAQPANSAQTGTGGGDGGDTAAGEPASTTQGEAAKPAEDEKPEETSQEKPSEESREEPKSEDKPAGEAQPNGRPAGLPRRQRSAQLDLSGAGFGRAE